VTVVHFLIIVVLRYTGGRGYITCSGYLFNDLIDETVTMLRGVIFKALIKYTGARRTDLPPFF
jgi:hypothetical protein